RVLPQRGHRVVQAAVRPDEVRIIEYYGIKAFGPRERKILQPTKERILAVINTHWDVLGIDSVLFHQLPGNVAMFGQPQDRRLVPQPIAVGTGRNEVTSDVVGESKPWKVVRCYLARNGVLRQKVGVVAPPYGDGQ